MKTDPKTQPQFPPIRADLVETLAFQADIHTTNLDEAEGTPRALPDLTSHVALLVLALVMLFLYVPLVTYILI